MSSTAASQMAARVDELSEELIRTIEDAQTLFHQEADNVFREYEANRVQLHTEYSQLLLEADRDLQKVRDEQDTFYEPGAARQNDVVTLNVGGQLFTVKRETLCMCQGSFMADLFSGRWDGALQQDTKGNIFLDFDPYVFELVLNWLRDRKIETPDRPAATPVVSQEDLCHFQALVDYLGLRPFMSLKGLGPDSWGGVRPQPASTKPAPKAGTTRDTNGFLGVAGSFWASFGSGVPTAASASSQQGGSRNDGDQRSTGPRKVGWSRRFAHPQARCGDGDEANVVSIGDTRSQAGAAAVRATRGYQTGEHYWEVLVREASDWSYIGFVSAEWGSLCLPIGRAPHSWGIASDGTVYACMDEVLRLPSIFASGSKIGVLLRLEAQGRRTATYFVDGRCYEDLFVGLPDTVYPAVSNTRSPAEYSLACDLEPPDLYAGSDADGAEGLVASGTDVERGDPGESN